MGLLSGLCPVMLWAQLAPCPVPANSPGPAPYHWGLDDFGSAILFSRDVVACQQVFSNSQRTNSVTPEHISGSLGGSNAVVIPRTGPIVTGTDSMNNIGVTSADLTAIDDYTLLGPTQTPTFNFPNAGGTYNHRSIFNFYVKRRANQNCRQRHYSRLIRYLRNNAATIFTTAEPNGGTTASNATNEIATISAIKLTTSTGETIDADLTFVYANPNIAGQFFTRNDFFYSRSFRFCWVGVTTRLTLTNLAQVEKAGNYSVTVRIVNP